MLAKILEVYALRWSIEVYFKEIKQNLGFLKEQSGRYHRESGRLQTLTYAVLLWQLVRALIEGALDSLIKDLGRQIVKRVLSAIDQTVEAFLTDALHMSPHHVSVQLKAEELG